MEKFFFDSDFYLLLLSQECNTRWKIFVKYKILIFLCYFQIKNHCSPFSIPHALDLNYLMSCREKIMILALLATAQLKMNRKKCMGLFCVCSN